MIIATSILRYALAAILVVAAAAKAVDASGFARTLAGLGLHRVSQRRRLVLARCAIVAEATAGFLTASTVFPQPIDFAVAILAFGFVCVSVYGTVRGTAVHCRCFGALSGTSFSTAGVARAIFVFALAVACAWLGNVGYQLSVQTLLLLAVFALLAVAAAQASAALSLIQEVR